MNMKSLYTPTNPQFQIAVIHLLIKLIMNIENIEYEHGTLHC